MRYPFLLNAALFLLAGCTTSDVILTGRARPATLPEAVRIFLRPPAKFESIGLVTAMSNSTPLRSKNKQSALGELRAKAASVGANGIILTQDDGTPGGNSAVFIPTGSGGGGVIAGGGRQPGVEMKGEAIYVKAE